MLSGKQLVGGDMIEYLMRIYLPGERLHQTRSIFAPDDVAAEAMAQKFYDELVAEFESADQSQKS